MAEIQSGLSEEEKQQLLEIARSTIEHKVKGQGPPEVKVTSPLLKEKRGAFVTIKKRGILRGCIGYIEALKPLAQTIQEMAEAAALNDPRFPPVTPDELRDLEIEISVLTPLEKIDDVKKIKVGIHGILIKKGFYQGLLLPQVATEYGWDRETFLEHTCNKAGLPGNAWRDSDTEILIFSADVFGEEEF
jgi:AmmeMemoRadiSam system protein A